jgi:hypothetical protein
MAFQKRGAAFFFSYRSLLVEVLVKRRREALLADRHVADRHVAEKIQLGGLAPKARNDQPQRFYHDRPQTGRPLLTNRQGRQADRQRGLSPAPPLLLLLLREVCVRMALAAQIGAERFRK